MKKRILLIGIIVFLLAISYFAGESSVSEQEYQGESAPVGLANLAEEMLQKPLPEAEIKKETEQKATSNKKETVTGEKITPIPAEIFGKVEQKEESAIQKENQGTLPKEPDAETKTTCSLSVRCDEVFSCMDKLKKGKETIIPEDGVFCPETKVEFSEGESVFDVLYREMRNRNIHFEFVKTPAYDSVYIEGIGNLYEFDCGDYSGWSYRVNGVKPNVGCSQYQVKSGDVIVFYYTCNFLKDR